MWYLNRTKSIRPLIESFQEEQELVRDKNLL